MRILAPVLILLALSAGFVPCPAAPSLEAQIAIQDYMTKRADGLIRLNETFIESYEEVKRLHLSQQRLDLAQRTEAKIKRLRQEIEELKAAASKE